MTSYAADITPIAAPARNRTGPTAATVAGAVAAFFALVLIAGGAALLWVSSHETDSAGYYTSSVHQYSTSTRALTTESLDVNLDAPNWVFSPESFGRVRIDPRTSDAAKPVFVGVGRTRDVERYLDQVQRDQVTDVDFDPFTLEKHRHAGEARPAVPTAQTFWAASSANGRALDWKVRSGRWSVVMMNADGSPGVHVAASVGAKAPIIRELGWWLMIPGLALGAIATVLVVLGARSGRTTAQPAVAIPAG
jgi:hypothetical protein